MPKKEKDAVIEIDEPVTESVITKNVCGHTNKQYTNIKGKLEDLACTLPAGHGGDHEAPCKALATFSGEKDPDAEYIFRDGKYYLVVESVAAWSDVAGTPAANIQPDYEGYATRSAWEQARKLARSENKIQ